MSLLFDLFCSILLLVLVEPLIFFVCLSFAVLLVGQPSQEVKPGSVLQEKDIAADI